MKRVQYSLIELMSKGPSATVLVAGVKIPEKMHWAPLWYLYFEMDQLPAWFEASAWGCRSQCAGDSAAVDSQLLT